MVGTDHWAVHSSKYLFSAKGALSLLAWGVAPGLMMDAAPLALNTKDSLRDLFERKWSFVFRFEFDHLLSV